MRVLSEPGPGGAIALTIDLHANPSATSGANVWLIAPNAQPMLVAQDVATDVL
jgi:hypothetical protein